MPAVDCLVVTCEHGGNNVPREYKSLFDRHRTLLDSHRGYDPGALTLALRFARAFGCPLISSHTTRLLVELNRSVGHPALFSGVTRPLDDAQRRRIVARYYEPYRSAAETTIGELLAARRTVLHLSVHSFTPVLDGVVRQADVGLLYDPRRPVERRFCALWCDKLLRRDPTLRVRRNYPYRGSSDGLTTHLRRFFNTPRYLGIELEVNQKYTLGPPAAWTAMQKSCIESIRPLLSIDD